MKRLFLHAGHFKTGTTALQVALAECRPALSAAGFLYPDLGGFYPHQHGDKLTARKPEREAEVVAGWREIAAALRQRPEHSIILSGETASHFSRAHFAAFQDAFEGFETILVFALRHWAGFLPSRWQQSVRSDADGLSFSAVVERLRDDFPLSINGDISLPLQRAHGALNRLAPVAYATQEALPRVLNALDLPADLQSRILAAAKRDNQSSPFLDREFLRMCNLVHAEHFGLQVDHHYRMAIDASVPAKRTWRRAQSFMQSDAPSARELKTIICAARIDAPMTHWASLFEAWTQQVNARLEVIGLAPMPEDWGRDEFERSFAYTELQLADLPETLRRDCIEALLAAPA